MRLQKTMSFSKQISFDAGFSLRRFGVGFAIDGYSFSLDLGPFWFGIEY